MGVSRHLEVSLLGGSCFSKGPTSSLPSFLRDSYLRGVEGERGNVTKIT